MPFTAWRAAGSPAYDKSPKFSRAVPVGDSRRESRRWYSVVVLQIQSISAICYVPRVLAHGHAGIAQSYCPQYGTPLFRH